MRSHNFLVGFFVLAGLTIFTVGIFLVGNRNGVFARHVAFYTEFTNLSGLTTGSKVKVAGMDAGQIIGVDVPDNPSSRFRVKFQIDQRLHGLVRTDSVATIATEGVVGGTFLLVRSGSSQAMPAAPFTTLPSQEPVDISKLLEHGLVLLKDADTTVNQLGAKLNGTLDGVTTTVANVNDVVMGLKQGRGAAGMLLRDETLASHIRQSVSNVQQATVDLHHASGQVDALASDLRSRDVTKKVDETVDLAKNAATNLNATTAQVRRTIAAATAPDKQGVDAGTNARESLSNLNTASASMAEDMEALKHNFLLRGFFRRRGYYNLTSIPPEKYRNDHVFSNPANERAWLPATELFAKDGSNSEILSASGKQRLNAAIGKYGDSVINDPIVIEGYSEAADPAGQISSSRHRAILVREYLQTQFQLDQSNVGIVAMNNAPPDGLGHSQWDGVCVVFLRRH